MNQWADDWDTDTDPLAPFARPPRHESMAGHPAGLLRGAAFGLVLAAPFWALVGGLIWWAVGR